MDGGESQPSLHRVLLDRFQSLEASHVNLKEQFDVLAEEQRCSQGGGEGRCSWVSEEFFFAGSPHRSVLEHMGHAVHVSRPDSEEIIYW